MLSHLTCETFAPLLHQTFRMGPRDGAVEAELIEATRLAEAEGPHRAPFSILLKAPPGTALPQAIYPVTHPALGTLEIFLVPLGPRGGGTIYQAIFS